MEKSKWDIIIGNKIKTLLDKRGIKHATFAKEVGIDGGNFRKLLNGKLRWNTTSIELVTEKLNIPITYLFSEKEYVVSNKQNILDYRIKIAEKVRAVDPEYDYYATIFFDIWRDGSDYNVRTLKAALALINAGMSGSKFIRRVKKNKRKLLGA